MKNIIITMVVSLFITDIIFGFERIQLREKNYN
jgi:hypothetical protein